MAKRKVGERLTTYETLERGGGSAALNRGLGEMPLTLWVLTAAIILYFYLRRARLGIDRHPNEKVATAKPAIRQPARPPSVSIRTY